MSTHIIDCIRALRLPAAESGHYDDLYAVATKGGSSNCFYSSGPNSGRRVSDWSPFAFGLHWECLRTVVDHARDVCGGCTRFSGSRECTPEHFIATFRKALDRAALWNSEAAPFRLVNVAITFDQDEREARGGYAYAELLRARPMEERGRPYCGPVHAFPFDFYGSAVEAGKFLRAAPSVSPWHHCKVEAMPGCGSSLVVAAAGSVAALL